MKKYEKKQKPSKKGAPFWMVTYSDMITLVLVFFVMLFSMSQIDMQKFKAIAESFRDRSIFEFYPSSIPFENPGSADDAFDFYDDEDKDENDATSGERDASLNALLTEVSNFIEESGLTEVVVATRTERGVVVVLPEQVLFNTGEAIILDTAKDFLDRVAELLKKIPNIVKVEGHTDNRPIHTVRYPSNWELSTARASSVIRYFIDEHQLDPDRFIATGYADTRPIAPNDGPENWQKNRRVEIVIMDPSYDGDGDVEVNE
ncbi:flagellar motor protein MotS [Fervidibacillus halotolerans]|uniref:Flagellar motor protein MotB n=1 Tax=Fervidibacillus halotolerans TaxID=2980027 RepID=A0A9E8LYQ9_9BACI|nr:flagellar motor protein MotS [Fervidibacillus halotolerans]WAA11735.1 flagellar motor protein MotB [Fervidibacillus halotolerans]